MMEAVRRAIRPLAVRVQNLIARAELAAANDTLPTQQVQVLALADEVRTRVQRLQEYGFTSVPLPGAYPCLLVCPFGDRAQSVVVAADDERYRPTGGAPGDVEVYDSRGNSVRLRNGELRIFAAADLEVETTQHANVTIHGTGTVTMGGDSTVNVTGNLTINATGVANVTAATVNLGGIGGKPVARVGDPVAGGVIVAGSGTVNAI